MAAPRTWWKGAVAALRASLAVPAGGDLITTTEGAARVGNGVDKLPDLRILIPGRDIPAEAGILFAIGDDTGRAALWVTSDGVVRTSSIALPTGSVDVGQLSGTLQGLVLQVLPPESGYVLAAADSTGRSAWAVTTTGQFRAFAGIDVTGALTVNGQPVGTAAATPQAMVVVTGTSPNRQIVYVAPGGRRTQLSSTGDNHDPVLLPNGRVLWFVGTSTAPVVTTVGSGLVVPAESTTDVAAFGDSLTEGVGAPPVPGSNGWPAKLATLLSSAAGSTIDVQNFGIGGQPAAAIVAREGAVRSVLTAALNVPADTSTAAAAMTLDPLWGSTLPRSATVTIGGIAGTLTCTGGAGFGAGTYTFARTTAGSAATIPAGTQIVFDQEVTGRARTHIIWPGRNDIRFALGTVGLTAAVAAAWTDAAGGSLNYVRRKLLIGITTRVVAGGSGLAETANDYAAIMAYNAAGIATYGRNFLDIDAYLRTAQALTDAGLTPTAQDTADIAAGLIPTQLHSSDGLHFTAGTYTLIANQIYARMRELGWST